MVSLNVIKSWFKTGLKPTQDQFWTTWESFWHKEDKIPMQNIDGLDSIIAGKADTEILNNHITDTHAHEELFELKADKEALEEHLKNRLAHIELFDQKVDKVEGMGLSEEDFTTELREKLEGLGESKVPTLDAVLGAGNSSIKSMSLGTSSSSIQKTTVDFLGVKVYGGTTSNYGHLSNDTIKFSASNGGGSVSLKADSFRITGNYTQNIQNKSGTIALLQDIPSGNSEPTPKKAIFNITFEIDPDGNKTFNHKPLFNNAGKLVLKGKFITDLQSENNIILQLSLEFPQLYDKAVCMQENINIKHIATTPDSRYFGSLFFIVEKSNKGTLDLITTPFMFMCFNGESKKLTFNAEFLLMEEI